MSDFFKLIYKKQKKIISSLLLFFVLIGIFLPKAAFAIDIGITTEEVGTAIIKGLSNLIYKITIEISLSISDLFLEVLNKLIKDPDSNWRVTTGIFLTGWNATKNLANMLIVLAIIGIAVATILRFREFEAKKLLLPMIIVALLINFSNVFVGLFIDTSNIIMKDFTVGAEQGAGIIGTISGVASAAINETGVRSANTIDAALKGAAIQGVASLMYILVGLALLYLIVLLIVRYVLLGILFILAPLAFVFRVFPVEAAKKLWSSWWQNFIKWCFIGVSGMFFLWLSVQMLNSEKLKIDDIIINVNKPYAAFGILMFRLGVVLLLLVIGLKVTTKSADPITKAVIGLTAAAVVGVATGGVALAVGAGAKALGGAGKVTGISGAAQRARESISDRATQLGEALGYYQPGTRKLQQQARLEKDNNAKGIAALDPVGRERLVTGSAVGEKAKNQKVESIKQMAEKGELKNLTSVQRKDAMEYGTYHGLSEDIFLKADPDLAEHAKKSKAELIRTGKASNDAEATKMLASKAYTGFRIENIDQKSDEEVVRKAREETAEGAKHLEEGIKRGILDMVGSFNEVAGYLQNNKNNFGSNAIREAVKSDPLFKKFDTQAVDRQLTSMGLTRASATPGQISNAEEQLVEEAYNRSDISDLSKEALGRLAFSKSRKPKSLQKALERAPKSKVNAMKKILDPSGPEYTELIDTISRLRLSGKLKEADELSEVIRTIDVA